MQGYMDIQDVVDYKGVDANGDDIFEFKNSFFSKEVNKTMYLIGMDENENLMYTPDRMEAIFAGNPDAEGKAFNS
jgi:hypothetical protein